MGLRARVRLAWVSLSSAGIAGQERAVQRAILGANHFFLLGGSVAVVWLLAFIVRPAGEQPEPAATHALMIVTWVACVWMNGRRQFLAAASVGLIAAIAEYGYLTHIYGRDAGFQLALLAIPTLAFVMFEERRRTMRLLMSAAVGAMVIWIYTDPSFAEPVAVVPERWMVAVAVGNVASALLIFATVALYNDVYLRRERARADALLAEATIAADTDALTGLLNRRGIDPVLRRLPAEGPYAVVLVDVDRFKAVNDELGHAAGDRVLARVAAVLQESVGGRGLIARWGGEEFLIVLQGETMGVTERFAETLRADVSENLGLDGPARVTVSVGAAWAPFGTPEEDAVRLADACLYEAKAAGRNASVARRAGQL